MAIKQSFPMCCGASIITGFSNKDEDDAKTIPRLCNSMYGAHLHVCILNEEQIRTHPKTIATLEQCGFVLTTSWINGVHGSRLYLFTRASDRRRVDDTMFWRGQVIDPTMRGAYPKMPTFPSLAPAYTPFGRAAGPQVGDRVRVYGTSRRAGQEFIIEALAIGPYGDRYVVLNDNGTRFRIASHNATIIARAAEVKREEPPKPAEPDIPLMVHEVG